MDRFYISEWFRNLQDSICTALEQQDGKAIFLEDHWSRPGGGGGRNRISKNANTIEKGNIHFAELHGHLSDLVADEFKVEKHHEFFATGLTTVMYPFNPSAPSFYMDLQYFQISTGEKWFTAGMQLIPCYLNATHENNFKSTLKKACDATDKNMFALLNKNAATQFFLQHRKEKLGVDGIFFGKFSEKPNISIENCFTLIQDIGDTFLPVYSEILETSKAEPVDKNALQWQSIRRSRIAEFMLMYDNRFRFGIETGESSDMLFHMLPPELKWPSKFTIAPESEEDLLMNYLTDLK